MNAKAGRVADVEQCQVFGGWLRAMVKFNPWSVGGGDTPAIWLNKSRGSTNPPVAAYFNYPAGSFAVPAPPEPPKALLYNSNAICHNYTSSNGTYFPSADPWNQVNWTCPQPEYQGQGASTTTTWRAWVNFDLSITGGGGEPVWPITTEFAY